MTPWRTKLTASSITQVEEAMVELTPIIMETLLKNHNPDNNRNLSKRKVNEMRLIIKSSWNPELPDSTISFGVDLQLKNGQHRLSAAILEGVNLITRVEIGHENNILQHLDQGYTRSEQAQAKILGRPKAEKSDYASVKMLYKIEQELSYFPLPKYEVYNLIDTVYDPELFDIVPLHYMKDPDSGSSRQLVYTIRATLLFLAQYYPKEVKEFVRQIRELDFKQGRNGGPGLLYTYMTASKNFLTEKQTYKGKWSQVMRTFKAFHLFQTNQTRDRLRASTDSAITLRRQIDSNYRPKAEGPFALGSYDPKDKD